MATKFDLLVGAKVTGENNIKKLGNSLQGVQGKAKNLGNTVKGVGAAFKTLFAAAAVAGFGAIVKGAIDSADAFGKLSTRTGIAADQLQAYVNAGKLADVSQAEIETGLRKLAQTQLEASEGVATYSDAYAKLGVSVKTADGKLKPSDQLLGDIADKFKDLPNGPEKASVAMDIFGRSGAKLITMLNGGSEALERFNYETSENFAQNAEFFNDQVEMLKIGFDGFTKQLADALLPALNAILEVFGDLFASGQDFGPLFKGIEIGVRGISSVVLALVQSMRFFVRTISDLAKIAQLVINRDFGGAFDVAKTGLADTREQFFTDMAAQGKVLFGTSEAPESYFGQGFGQFGSVGIRGGSSRGTTRSEKKQASERKQATEEMRNLILQINEARVNGNQFALAGLEYDKAVLEIKEKELKGNNLIIAQSEAITQYDLARMALFADTTTAADGLKEKVSEVDNLFKSITDTVQQGLTNAIMGLIDGTKSLSDSLTGILRQMSSMFLQFGMKSLFGSIFPSAKGNVFAENKIVPFAYGGVVNKPTLFPMANGAGLMGEAGPEAIMPLRRGPGGRLGVESSGGGVKVGTINITVENTGENLTPAAQKQIASQVRGIVLGTLADERRTGGML